MTSGVCAIHTVIPFSQDDYIIMSTQNNSIVFGTEDILRSLCNSVTKVLTAATQSQIHYSGMVQRITKTCLKPDIGCFVLFDGGFAGLVVINFSAASAMELYQRYMVNMGMAKDELAASHTSDEVSNVMGELMNQIVGDFTSTVARELQTHITQSQPKMLALHKQVMLSVDTNLDQPESRRVTFFTGHNNIFYLELAIDRTEFIKLNDFETQQAPDPDELIAEANKTNAAAPPAVPVPQAASTEQDDFLKSLGM
jgi:chemotaxis protein CheY-P-specific phosphatase CheC